jgi:hypothetical protein
MPRWFGLTFRPNSCETYARTSFALAPWGRASTAFKTASRSATVPVCLPPRALRSPPAACAVVAKPPFGAFRFSPLFYRIASARVPRSPAHPAGPPAEPVPCRAGKGVRKPVASPVQSRPVSPYAFPPGPPDIGHTTPSALLSDNLRINARGHPSERATPPGAGVAVEWFRGDIRVVSSTARGPSEGRIAPPASAAKGFRASSSRGLSLHKRPFAQQAAPEHVYEFDR